MRSTISDFAVFLTIMIMVLVDYLVGIPSPKLNVPDCFEVCGIVCVFSFFTNEWKELCEYVIPSNKVCSQCRWPQ